MSFRSPAPTCLHFSVDAQFCTTRTRSGPGGTIGYVGVPHGVQEEGLNVMGMFFKHLTLRGGGAPARAYMSDLMTDVVEGKLDPSPIFDMTVGLDRIPDGYAE